MAPKAGGLIGRMTVSSSSECDEGGGGALDEYAEVIIEDGAPCDLPCDAFVQLTELPACTIMRRPPRTAQHGVKLDFIQPGKPMQNGHVESFNGRFRDECLSQNHFPTLARARAEIEIWRAHYNCERPHSSLDARTPKEFGDLVRCKVPPSAGAAAAPLDRVPLRSGHHLRSNRVEHRIEIN